MHPKGASYCTSVLGFLSYLEVLCVCSQSENFKQKSNTNLFALDLPHVPKSHYISRIYYEFIIVWLNIEVITNFHDSNSRQSYLGARLFLATISA